MKMIERLQEAAWGDSLMNFVPVAIHFHQTNKIEFSQFIQFKASDNGIN